VIIAARGWERRGAAPPLRHQWRIPGKENIWLCPVLRIRDPVPFFDLWIRDV
jgi:hypothetical protein